MEAADEGARRIVAWPEWALQGSLGRGVADDLWEARIDDALCLPEERHGPDIR